MSDGGYKHYVLTTGFECIYDNEELMQRYFDATGKEYEELDDTMIEIIRDFKQHEQKLYHVKNSMVPYIIIEHRITHDKISFDFNKYKIDMIKKILSSETNLEDSIIIIESLVFQQPVSPILTDSEYLLFNI